MAKAGPPSGIDPTDIAQGNWVDRWLPAGTRPYARLARLDRPIGTWLLLLPCWWGLAYAVSATGQTLTWLHLWYGVLFGIGAIAMRGAGCTWNDIVDRDIDGKVARTATRPIPSGDVSPWQAFAFLVFLCLIGLAVLLQFNAAAIWTGIGALALVFCYPFMKRITYFPQAWLGLTFNWGVHVGFIAVAGAPDPRQLLLYAAGFFWTMGYDTIYAHQDKEDDALIGVKSTALKFGDATRPWIAGFYVLVMALLCAAAWTGGVGAGGVGWGVWALLALAALHLGWQVRTVDFDGAKSCLHRFRANRHFGMIVTAAFVAGAVTVPL
ncbi:4-hydroxybenzoate octaprenyltransferase [Marivibrio halodurans]|uniref:4-hydroxybenzoate octaprenyltransferase n=1 Tax=Marivibrio halodurans TaxID=2039722 RepID=A0A8J7V3L4_9PROT|nr:4-hydroxybenzoate octaprenyltransferase [Marivibrio halodurans]MBP5858495.1 4-hydroxybenzoate octaprenyltransferase [Marivibrio halodurans]